LAAYSTGKEKTEEFRTDKSKRTLKCNEKKQQWNINLIEKHIAHPFWYYHINLLLKVDILHCQFNSNENIMQIKSKSVWN